VLRIRQVREDFVGATGDVDGLFDAGHYAPFG
jgi:hypothetical protein